MNRQVRALIVGAPSGTRTPTRGLRDRGAGTGRPVRRRAGSRRSARAATATAASRAAVASSHGQRAVRRPEPQRVRQRLAALAELLAGVDVEQPQRLQQLARRPRAAPPRTSAAGTASSTTSATSMQRRREGRRSPAPARHRRRRQRVEVELHRAGARGQLQRRARPAGAARRRARRPGRRRPRSSAQRPGCHGAVLGRPAPSTLDAGLGGGEHVAGGLDGVGPAGRAARRPTSRPARASPASTTATCRGWSGTRRVSAASSSSVGPPVDAQRRRRGRRRRAGGRPGRSRTAPGRAGRGRGCARSVAEQAGQQRGAQQRLLLGQRVGQPHRRPARVVGGQAELRRASAGADERVGRAPRRSPASASARPTAAAAALARRSGRGRAARSAAPTGTLS